MGASVQFPPRSMPLHSMECDGEPPSQALAVLDCVELLDVAITRAGLLKKQAAAEMGIDESQLTRQLKKREHLSLLRASALPLPVWREFCLLLAAHCSLVLSGMDAEDAERAAIADVAEAFAKFLRVRR
jgi:hypothetical protein